MIALRVLVWLALWGPLTAKNDNNDGATAAVDVLSAGEVGAVPFAALALGVVEIVLLHCDAHSLGHIFFGGALFSRTLV